MQRRDFLKYSLLGLGAAVLAEQIPHYFFHSKPKLTSTEDWVLLSYSSEKEGGPAKLRFLNWKSRAFKDVEIPSMRAHSIVQSKLDKNEYFIFDFFGSTLKYNISSSSFININQPKSGNLSFGHGVQTNDGEHIFCTEVQQKPYQQKIVIRSTKTLEKVLSLPSYFGGHHIVHLPNSNLVACGGGDLHAAEVVFYDYKKDSVVSKVQLPFHFVHLTAFSSNGVFGVGSRSKLREGLHMENVVSFDSEFLKNPDRFVQNRVRIPAPYFYADTKGVFKPFGIPTDNSFHGNGFGVTFIPSKQIVIGTFPRAKESIVAWKDFEQIKSAYFPGASSGVVSANGKEFIVLGFEKLGIFSTETLEQISVIPLAKSVCAISGYV